MVTQHLFVEEQARETLARQRLLSLGIDRYIAVSEEVARGLRRCVLWPRRVRVIHNGIPVDAFRFRSNSTPLRSLAKGRRVILTLARLHPQKGLSYLIDAALRVPEALFVIAGDGLDRADLERHARSLGVADRVLLLGQRDDVADLLADCDAFVLPSLWEGLPVSILEAMAAGKPVIASEIPGNDEAVVHGVTGLLVPPRAPAALADAIASVLADSAFASRLGAAGRARAQDEFSAETMVYRTTALYEEIFSRRGRHDSIPAGPALSARVPLDR